MRVKWSLPKSTIRAKINANSPGTEDQLVRIGVGLGIGGLTSSLRLLLERTLARYVDMARVVRACTSEIEAADILGREVTRIVYALRGLL